MQNEIFGLCACGCGETFMLVDNRGRPRKYIYGHQGRQQPHDKRETLLCEVCGASFRRPQWHIKRVKHHFCSRNCEGIHAKQTGRRRGERNGHFNSITVPCSGGCGASVTKAESLIKRRNGRVYCPNCVHLVRKGRRGFYVDYPPEFSSTLRTTIRKRDGYCCQLCKKPQKETGTLHVHHIDYTKTNNDPSNLIALCRVCHGQTNFGTDQWQLHFRNFMAARGL